MVGVWKDGLQKKFDHLGLGGLRVAGKIVIVTKTCQAHVMLQSVQDAAWNETSHPKSIHIYLLSHQTIPAIQPNNNIIPTGYPQHPKSVHIYLLCRQTIPAIQPNNNIIPTGYPQHTIKPHCRSVSISVVIFHTAHRATGSRSLAVCSKQYTVPV